MAKKKGLMEDERIEKTRVNDLLRDDARNLGLGTKESVPRLRRLKSDLNAFSPLATLEFREFIRRKLESTGSGLWNRKQLETDGAVMLEVFKPITAKRYMDELLADGGPFRLVGDMVSINPHYKPPSESDYWDYWDKEEPLPGFVGKRSYGKNHEFHREHVESERGGA